MMTIRKFPTADGNIGWYELSPYQNAIQSCSIGDTRQYDFVIVGAGFSGVSTAQRLAELHPSASIALVDALKVGQGASGRNSGFMVNIPIVTDLAGFDVKQQAQLFALNRFSRSRLWKTVKQHNLKTDWSESGMYLAASGQDCHKAVDNYLQVLASLNEAGTLFEQSALSKKLGTGFYTRAAYSEKGSVLVNPASLIIGLAQVLPKNIDLYENSPLRAIQLKGEKRLSFDRGMIKADRVILTTNAFNDVIQAPKHRLAPMITYASMTRVLNDKELSGFSETNDYGLLSAHAVGTTVRFTKGKRLLIRNSFRASIDDNQSFFQKTIKKHRLSLANRFPDLRDVPFEYSWGGNICVTMNRQPCFSEVEDGVYSLAGMNGSGILKGTYLGYYLAEHITGNSSPELDFILRNSKPTFVPPEPLRTLGASARMYYEERSAGNEV